MIQDKNASATHKVILDFSVKRSTNYIVIQSIKKYSIRRFFTLLFAVPPDPAARQSTETKRTS